jgi:cell fate regulator YaaT (PSP1 superfamily)
MNDQVVCPIVGVSFGPVGKIYHFDTNHIEELNKGDYVIVETSRGLQIGKVIELYRQDAVIPDGEPRKPVMRKATPRDLMLRKYWEVREAEVYEFALERSKGLNLEGVKIVAAEYSFDGSRIAILFSNEAEEKIDLKILRKDVQKKYNSLNIEMRQIGPRDVAKIIGGMGACGLEKRCCSMYLTDFKSISIRMAKNQGISLTPTEITGMCGRLRCCLDYEHDQYVEALGALPKKNKRVNTPLGKGKVIGVNPMMERIMVDIPEIGPREFDAEQITPAGDEPGENQRN